MAIKPRGLVDVDQLIKDELDPTNEPGSFMRVVFEEIIDLGSGTLLGHEALTRVTTSGIRISPEVWFGRARALGLAAQVEARAVELAIRNLPTGDGLISVNFSPDCLEAPEVQATLDKLAALSVVAVVELSEHHHITTGHLVPHLASLRDRGLLIAVDDAGTGESGPEFVLEVEPDIIKIDRSHVSQLHRNPAQRCFVHRYAEMADDRESMIVTEGVSSPRIVDALAELGAKWGLDFHGQGYWLSHNRELAARLAAQAIPQV